MNIEKTMEALRKYNMEAYYAKDRDEAREIIISLLKKGESVSLGGSVTLNEVGILPVLRKGDYTFYDRYEEGLSKEEIKEVFRKSFFADNYITSTNAITENGELYNVDGTGNRVAAMIYGPNSVIVVAGKNKIVENMKEAKKRIKMIAAPKNAKRLKRETYCSEKACCMGIDAESECEGCASEQRICADYVAMGRQSIKGRIKVIIVNEELGY